MTRGDTALIYVQHLLGMGHLRRALALGEALAAEDYDVHVVSGGKPAPEIVSAGTTLHQLPPISAKDGSFQNLVDEQGAPVDSSLCEKRKQMLLDLYHDLRPNVILVEAFPFARRQMRFELMPFLNRAASDRERPGIFCSVRDVLQRKKPEREREVAEVVNQFFDVVLVHGDPAFISFEETFGEAARIEDRIHYTGFVGSDYSPAGCEARRPAVADRQIVLVSAGGGAAGERLYRCAVRAARLTRDRPLFWHVLVGSQLPEHERRRLADHSGENIIVEPNRRDFRDLLRQCTVSVSQAGYNTFFDLLVTGARSLLVPFDAGGSEQEQQIRASRLQQLGRAKVLPESELGPERLVESVARLLAMPKPGDLEFMVDGAKRSAALVAQWQVAQTAMDLS